MEYYGDFAEDATVYIPFNTFTSDDPQASSTITNLVDADIQVHKDGGLTQIATDGATVIINFDSITGNHLITIDTSVDAAYATGSDYMVRIEGTTVDGATINAWIGTFSIENRFNAVGTGTGLTAIPWNSAWDAEVQSEVNDALVALGLDHLVNAAVVGADVTDNSIIAKLVSASATAEWDDFVNTSHSLQAIISTGNASWATGAGSSNIRTGTAQAGSTASTIKLDSGASSITNFYKGADIHTDGGTGANQVRTCTAYDGITKVATIGPDDWKITLDATTTFIVKPVFNSIIDAANPIDANVVEWDNTAVVPPTTAGVPEVDASFVGGTAQTANDNAADINTILSRIIGTLASGTHNPATAAQIAVLSDWINDGRLDLILDIIAADVVNIDGEAMRGTNSALTTKTGFSLSPTGLDAIASTATGMVEIAKSIWDRVLSGATHNISNSAGKRLRVIQEAGAYEHGAVWVDTVDGTTGTTPFDNGTITSKSLTFADALSIANNAALNLKRFEMTADSSVTLAATINDRSMSGHGWALALGGQNIAELHVIDADITGVSSGLGWEFHDSHLNGVTVDAGTMHDCYLEGTTTFSSIGQYHIHNCHAADGGVTPIFDIGAALGNTTILIHNWHGAVEIHNLGAAGTDTLSLTGLGELDINSNCVGGTINIQGSWKLTGAAAFIIAGGTINYDDNTANIAATVADTNELQTAHSSGNLGADIDKVNGVPIVGDGSGTPFDV